MLISAHLTTRRVRLASGLVMFAYLSAHLLNHALGIFSLTLAEAGLKFAMLVWRHPAGTLLLYGAAAVHVALALWTLMTRREWQLPLIEIVRLAAGFSFPLLLINHAVSARLGDALFDFPASYTSVVGTLVASGSEGTQLALFAPGWVHGCLGLWISLRRFDLMQRLKPVLIALVILVPIMAAAGFLRMTAEVATLAPRAPATADILAGQAVLGLWKDWLRNGYLATIAAAFLFGRFRAWTLGPLARP